MFWNFSLTGPAIMLKDSYAFIITSLKTKKWRPPMLCRKNKLYVKSHWKMIKLYSLQMKLEQIHHYFAYYTHYCLLYKFEVRHAKRQTTNRNRGKFTWYIAKTRKKELLVYKWIILEYFRSNACSVFIISNEN